jgi:hypothetical protein
MCFDLIHSGHDNRLKEEMVEAADSEVGYTNGAHLAGWEQLLHGLVSGRGVYVC